MLSSRPLISMTMALAALAGSAAPLARSGAQAPALATSLVPVDVHVLDRSGKPVTGLAEADFTVLEDGVPQQIRYLSPVALPAGTAQAGAQPAGRTSAPLTPPDHRVFVFMLGMGRLEDPSGSVSGLSKFVKARLLPQDQVAIVAYDRALNFTTDRQKIVAALERFKKGHANVDFEVSTERGATGMASLYGSRALPKKVQSRIDEMIAGPGAPPPTPFTGPTIQPQEFLDLPLDDFTASCAVTLDDQSSLMSLMEYLRHFNGEKHVVFVSEKGLLSPSDENDRLLATLASDARTSVHAFMAGGMAIQPDSGRELNNTWELARASRSLRAITDLTGGLPAFNEKGPAALDRLDEATRAGYLLGYQSSRPAWDGGYRQIVVKVNRPETTVLYRHGYYRQPTDGAFDRRGAITNDRLSAAANFRREVGDIKVKLAVSQRRGNEFVVDGRIDLSRVKLDAVGGNRVGELRVVLYGFDSGSNPTGAHPGVIPLRIPDAQYEQALKDGYPFQLSFPALRGTRDVRFVVYDFGSDLVGRVDTRVF